MGEEGIGVQLVSLFAQSLTLSSSCSVFISFFPSLYSAVEVTSVPGDVLHGKLSANDEGMWASGEGAAAVP